MNKSVNSALRAALILVCISVVCVGLLAVCNMFFPKYVPTLDGATAALINQICPTGVSDGEAYDGGYIVMLYENDHGVALDEYNKANKKRRASILAVYGEKKGDHVGAYIIESKSQGNDGDIIILVAYEDGKIVGAAAKKHLDTYWDKIVDANVFDTLVGASGEVELAAVTGATHSHDAIERAVNISNIFAKEYGDALAAAIAKGGSGE